MDVSSIHATTSLIIFELHVVFSGFYFKVVSGTCALVQYICMSFILCLCFYYSFFFGSDGVCFVAKRWHHGFVSPKVLVRLRDDPVGIAFPLANWPGSWYTWQAGAVGSMVLGLFASVATGIGFDSSLAIWWVLLLKASQYPCQKEFWTWWLNSMCFGAKEIHVLPMPPCHRYFCKSCFKQVLFFQFHHANPRERLAARFRSRDFSVARIYAIISSHHLISCLSGSAGWWYVILRVLSSKTLMFFLHVGMVIAQHQINLKYPVQGFPIEDMTTSPTQGLHRPMAQWPWDLCFLQGLVDMNCLRTDLVAESGVFVYFILF